MVKIKFIIISHFLFFVFAVGVKADTLGQGQAFFISPQYDVNARAIVSATLRHISDHAYFYVADDYWIGANDTLRSQTLSQIENLAQEFDQRIYPVETQFFGSEPNPGVDNDSRITILLAPLIENAGGYFDATNEHPAAEVSNSNQREMIYINIGYVGNTVKIFPFLAHEFQHLISFNQKENINHVSDDVWLNELRSEYAPVLLGYNPVFEGSYLQRRVNALLNDPSDSLTEWKNLPSDYAQISLFGEYIAEHWSPRVIADTTKTNAAGLNSLALSLTKNGFGDTFLDIFRDWLIADFINKTEVNQKFGYSKAGLADMRVAPTQTITNLTDDARFSIADSIKDWQGRWYDVPLLRAGQKNVLKISFDSRSLASFNISYLIFKLDGTYQDYVFDPIPGSSTIYISGIGTQANRVVVMPIKKDKSSGFSATETPVQITSSFERMASSSISIQNTPVPVVAPVPTDKKNETANSNIPDGSLIRARGDSRVYVVYGNWRRHIISQKIFSFYQGLGFDKVLEVDSSVINRYQESRLVRYPSSKRIYSIDDLGVRHWLNISGEQFVASGRAWGSVFLVNNREINFYRFGTDIKS